MSEWEDLERTCPEDNGSAYHSMKIDRKMHAFAARLAGHGDIVKAALSLGLSRADGMLMFKRICDDLGAQAR